jgi:hypothetical protein
MLGKRTSLALADAAAVLIAATGCGSGSGSGPGPGSAAASPTVTPPPAITTVPAAADMGSVQLPVVQYMLTPLQGAQAIWLQDRAVRECMARFGFDYPAAQAPPTAATTWIVSYSAMYRRYGISDAAQVRTWGYHAPSDTLAGSGSGSAGGQTTAKSALMPTGALAEVLRGATSDGKTLSTYQGTDVPNGGCAGEGSRLFPEMASPQGPGTAAGQPLAQVKSDSFTDSQNDPRLRPVVAAWQSCMAAAGYRVGADPLNASNNLASLNAPKPDAAEIAMAEADVACRTKTDLAGHWFALESDYQNAAISHMTSMFQSIREQRDAVAQRISTLLKQP